MKTNKESWRNSLLPVSSRVRPVLATHDNDLKLRRPRSFYLWNKPATQPPVRPCPACLLTGASRTQIYSKLLPITQEIGSKFPLFHKKKSSEVTDQGAETKSAAALRDLYRMRWNTTEELDTTSPVTLTHVHS